jgi:hypothetical protein
MDRNVAANKNTVPRELRNKIQPLVLTFFERPLAGTLFGLGFALLSLYGPIVGPPDHNGLRYLLAPWICPWVGAVYFLLVPYNPYRGSPLIVGKMLNLDQRDADARRLVELFQSREARHVLIRIIFKISTILFVMMALITVIVRDSLNWSFSSYWLLPGLLGCCIGLSIVIAAQYISWGLKNWASPHNNGS